MIALLVKQMLTGRRDDSMIGLLRLALVKRWLFDKIDK
jgi:hypothetical protein